MKYREAGLPRFAQIAQIFSSRKSRLSWQITGLQSFKIQSNLQFCTKR